MPASIVLGQENLWNSSLNPAGPVNGSNLGGGSYAMTFDAHGDLWVTDWYGNRVVEYVPPFVDGMSVSLVLGQSNFSGTSGESAAAQLNEPDGLAFDSQGNLWVSDYGNNRVVEFRAPFSDGEAASVVLGQPGFNRSVGRTSATTMNGPGGLVFDGSTLWVSDYSSNRVIGFPAPQTTGEAATIVLGQQNLADFGAATSAVNLSQPDYVAVDAHGNLWVADYGNNRAVMFPAPLSTGEAATVEVGQANFTT
ncbi:NHL repeat containing protein, partial [mine drainage metagenome]